MPLPNSPEFVGRGDSAFTLHNFFDLLTVDEQVTRIFEINQVNSRKRATDILFQMRQYHLDGIRGGSARPHWKVLRENIVLALSLDGDAYTFADSDADGEAVEAAHSYTTFSKRDASTSDDIMSIAVWIGTLNLQAIAYVRVSGTQARFYFAKDSQ